MTDLTTTPSAQRAGAAVGMRRPEGIVGIALQPVAFAFQAVALGPSPSPWSNPRWSPSPSS